MTTQDQQLPRLVDCAREAAAAGHGGKAAVYERYCREFGWHKSDGSPNLGRLFRVLAKAGLCEKREKRSDAGAHNLTQYEAEEIVRWQRENARSKGLRNMVSLKAAVDALRSNGHIKAEAVDPTTGEIRPLSYAAISKAITAYGLSAKVLDTPSPAIRMKTLHANHVWQVDASLCVLYYLPADGGLQVMSEVLFNENKPKNIKRIENERVWRYLVVDVASGCIYVEYVFGGESGANLAQVFINAMQQRRNEFWGVPKRVYCDAGSANTGAVFKGLCQQLGIDLQWHMPGNARATGAVEKPQDIVERNFESMLAARPVNNLDQLNEAATRWRIKFNAASVHTRHGKTRLAAWAQHVVGHLTAPPNVEVCRSLAYTKPVERRITQYLTIEFKGQDWDASAFPDVYRGMRVQVTRNPWAEDSIRIVNESADGLTFFECPLKRRNELGYWEDSPVMGEEFKRHAMTPPEKALARLAERSAADQGQDDVRRAKPMPFGGKIDPFKPLAETFTPELFPRKADAVHDLATTLVLPPLNLVEAAKVIKQKVESAGGEWKPEYFRWLAQRFPEGVPQDQVDNIAAELSGSNAGMKRPLRVVAGGGAC